MNTSGPSRPELGKAGEGPAWWAWVLLVLAAGLMLWRGSWRALGGGESSDFSLMYQSTVAFNHGVSPYDPSAMELLWAASGGPVEEPQLAPMERGAGLFVYPPTTFVVLAPLGVLPWPWAKAVWMGLNTVLLAWSVRTLGGLAGVTGTRWAVFSAMALAMAPGHTAIYVGQLCVVVFAMIVRAVSLGAAGRCVGAGVMLGLACALKPQLAVPFVVYEVARRRWTTVAMAAVVVAALAGAAVTRLEQSGVPWLEQFRANVALLTTSDNGDSSQRNVLAYQLVNLQAWLHTFSDDRALVWRWSCAVLGVMALAFAGVDRFRVERAPEFVSRSLVACLTILAVYHRAYDAVVLLLPLAWVFSAGAVSAGRASRWVVLGASACFLLPGASLLAAVKGRLPEAVTGSVLWTTAILPHAVIAVVVMGWALIAARAGQERGEPQP